MEKEIDRCCGSCCWFYGEMTDGDGFCALLKGSGADEFLNCSQSCFVHVAPDNRYGYVSRQEMRHHMAVLLQTVRRDVSFYGKRDGLTDAKEFACKYVKVFSKL